MALRFLGEESAQVPKDRVLKSLRLLLEEPKLADLVIADLARWQDWSAIDRLVELFEKAEADNIFVREPIVNYLRACPLPQAAEAITRLEKIDPEAVRRAATLAAFGGAVAPKPGGTPAGPTTGNSQSDDDGDPGDPTAARDREPRAIAPPTSAAAAMPAGAGGEAAIAARIPTVLADEEATDDAPGIDPSKPTPQSPAATAPPSGTTRSSTAWKWALWAVVVLLIAIFSRAKLRAGGTSPSVR
jgi:hypothetical protein